MKLEQALLSRAAGAVRGTWLIVLPASGTVFRKTGALLSVDFGGGSRVLPCVVDTKSGVAHVLDPRALVLDDATLRPAWQPRAHLHETDRMAAEWYAQNPDVFCPGTRSGETRLT